MTVGAGPRAAFLCLFATVLAAGAILPSPVSPEGAALAATSPDEVLEDPELERRARELAKELRCLVCQNQSIDDSDADLARDLRQLVRERLLAGDSDDEIITFVTARYGDFVLLRPPIKPSTWGLWYGPPGIFGVAAIALAFHLRRRRTEPASAPAEALSAEEQARLDRLLGREDPDPT